MLSSFALAENKGINKNEYEQEPDSSRSTYSTSASQSTEFESTEERISLERPNSDIDSVDIKIILSPSKSNNVNEIYKLKNSFSSFGKAKVTFNF